MKAIPKQNRSADGHSPPQAYKILSRKLPNEPTFTIRAKDNKSIVALRNLQKYYGNLDAVIQWFGEWRQKNQKHCKDPD